MADTRMCGTMPLHFEAVQSQTGYAETRRMNELMVASMRQAPLAHAVRIPVVVHIVAVNPDHLVTDRQIHEQIDILNRDFSASNADVGTVPAAFTGLVAGAGISFALATRDPAGRPTTGIIRKRTVIDRFPRATPASDDETASVISRELMLGDTGSVAWPRESYLNIWVCDMGRKYLGFATLPGGAAWCDGVVIDCTSFGASGTAQAPFDLGRTATHEVGHWLSLLHIWGDAGCERSDNVDDTPNQADYNAQRPTYPKISCDNGPHGDLFMNYMDYVDDAVMVMFTHGQVARMHATLQGARSGLLVSKGLEPPANAGSRSVPELLQLSAFGRRGQPQQQYFDGVSWVQVGDGPS